MSRDLPPKIVGGKVTTNHATVIAEAVAFIRATKPSSLVTKIVVGPIQRARGGVPRIKIVACGHTVRVTIRGHTAVQTLYYVGADGMQAYLEQVAEAEA